MIDEQPDFNQILYFEHKMDHESDNKPLVYQYYGSELVLISHAQREVRLYFFTRLYV